MLRKKGEKLLRENGFDSVRAFDLNAHRIQNGELYTLATSLNWVLVSCDSDFDVNQVARLGSSSIIYLKPKPDTSLKYLLPLLMPQLNKIP